MADESQLEVKGLSKGKRRLFMLALLVFGLIVGLIVAEIVLRIAGYSSPEFYQADETRGYALIPNMRGQYRKEGKSFVEINSDGFRDVEHTVAKPAGVTRIAVIGDSYVEAFQVEREESFVNFMQAEMEKCGAVPQIEVLTFGVSGYGTAQELLMLREKVLKYSPDIVMLVMTTNNDISDNARHFKRTAIPYFEYRGELTLDESFRSERAFIARSSAISGFGIWLKNNLRVVQAIGEIQVAIKYRYREWKEKRSSLRFDLDQNTAHSEPNTAHLGQNAPPFGQKMVAVGRNAPSFGRKMVALEQNALALEQNALALEQNAPSLAQNAHSFVENAGPQTEVGIDSQVYRAPADENWQNAWRVTQGILEMMNSEVRNAGARFIVVTASNGVQVLPSVETRKLFARSLGVDDLFYPDRRIAEFCRTKSIPVITLAPVLADYAEREQVNVHGFEGNIGYGHWNKLGHRMAGSELGLEMCRLLSSN